MSKEERLTVSVESGGKRTTAEYPIPDKLKIVIVINNQITNAPNTTQIASGAGRNSAAGNNAAIDSSNTQQQQSVGGAGIAKNIGMGGEQTEPHEKHVDWKEDEEIVIVINNQINIVDMDKDSEDQPEPQVTASATQVASGSGNDSAGGTNAAIGSSNTKQQFSVAGAEDSISKNKSRNAPQKEV